MDSHWAYQRPGYRCRHGHTSTRSPALPRPKILYAREDHLLTRIHHDTALHHQHPDLRDADPQTVATYLRDHNMILVGDHQSWALETDTSRTDLAPMPTLPFAAVPKQRHPQQSKGEEQSRIWWK